MKKFSSKMLLMIAAIASVAMFASCGDDHDPAEPSKPVVDNSPTGYYELEFPSLNVFYWPDNATGIEEKFDAYKKSIENALGSDFSTEKTYKWSDILAKKDFLQKAFNSCNDFEYSVKCCRNFSDNSQVALGAVPNDDNLSRISFGSKKVTCKLDVPANTTCQLFCEVSYPKDVEAYGEKLKSAFKEALKNEFAGEWHVETNSAAFITRTYMNSSEDYNVITERIKGICQAVKLPAITNTEKATDNLILARLVVYAYNPKAEHPSKSDHLFNLSVQNED